MCRQSAEKAELLVLPFNREVAPHAPAHVEHTGAGRGRDRRELHHAMTARDFAPSVIVKVEQPRRHGLVDAIKPPFLAERGLPRVVLIGDRLPPRQALRRGLVIQRDPRIGQVVEERLQPLVEKGQPMLDALVLAAGADGLVKRIVGAGRAELDAVILPEPRDRGLVEDHFGHRCQLHPFQLFSGALCRRIEAPRAIEHVTEKVKPHRRPLARRPDVDDAAAHGVIAGLRHRGGLGKAHPHQEILECALVDAPADRRHERGRAQQITRRHVLRGRVQRRQQDEGPRQPARQRGKRRHSRRRDLRVGRDAVIGQAIPARKGQDRNGRVEEGQRARHRGQPLVIACDMHDRHAALLQLAQDERGVEPLGRARGEDMGRRRGHGRLTYAGRGRCQAA